MTEEQQKEVVKECQSIEELKLAIQIIGDVIGSRGIVYTPAENLLRLRWIAEGSPMNSITRGAGLRAKVIELYENK